MGLAPFCVRKLVPPRRRSFIIRRHEPEETGHGSWSGGAARADDATARARARRRRRRSPRAPAQNSRVTSCQPAARPAAAGQIPAARRHAPGIARGTGRVHQGAGRGAAHRRARRSTARRPAHHSATKSSPANAAGAPRRSPGCPRARRHPARPDEAAIAMALIENIQREDLNPLEEARALERLINEFGITHQQAADAVGRSRAAVSNLLRLLELAPEITALRRAPRAGDGPCARAAGAHAAPPTDRSRRAGREEGPVGARNRGAGAQHAGARRGRQRREGQPKPSIRTCSGCRTSSRKNSARRCRSSTRVRARARWSSATTRSMSSTASWRTFASAFARRWPRWLRCRPRPGTAAFQDDFASVWRNWIIEAEEPGRIAAATARSTSTCLPA